MIFFDTTKTGAASHRSGLTRVSSRLRESLGSAAVATGWDVAARQLAPQSGPRPRAEDWFLTAELFSEDERPGFTSFVASRSCRLAAIFHDAIPLKHPHITWPQSVARHPGYMKLLAQFDHIWAVSQASRAELLGFWKWQGIDRPPPVDVFGLGADFNAAPRVVRADLRAVSASDHPASSAPGNPQRSALNSQHPSRPPQLLCLGILEPRKNQSFLLDVCEALWNEGLAFELHVVGRVNPHFGRPIVSRLKSLQRRRSRFLYFHRAAADATVTRLYGTVRATVFPTIAEGCGLPLLESLWMGAPCVCSDLPVLRENADGGGCLPIAVGDLATWKSALRRILTDDAFAVQLAREAAMRPLPTWKDAAAALQAGLS